MDRKNRRNSAALAFALFGAVHGLACSEASQVEDADEHIEDAPARVIVAGVQYVPGTHLGTEIGGTFTTTPSSFLACHRSLTVVRRLHEERGQTALLFRWMGPFTHPLAP